MATRKTVDQILDGAADILEKHGWVTGECYDSSTGGSCALGAITRAAHPRIKLAKIENASYVTDYDPNDAVDRADYRRFYGVSLSKNHVEAVKFLARRVDKGHLERPAFAVYHFNDSALDYENRHDPKEVLKSSRKVVRALRNAAKAYRKQQEKA